MTDTPTASNRSPGSAGALTAARAWTICGRRVAAPVEVRRAAQWSVQYVVPMARARQLLAPTGLEPIGPVPGRALMALAFCRYEDTDLGPYHEVAVSFVVRRHDAPSGGAPATRVSELATGAVGVYIHRLPVDQEFSCAAGREIWGFPKWVASIDIDEPPPGTRPPGTGASVRLVDGGVHVLTLSVAAGGRLRLPAQAPPTYSWADGVLRRTSWTTSTEGGRGRFGGARLTLGDHPMAEELRSISLPRRALFSSSAAQMRASFEAPEVVAPRPR